MASSTILNSEQRPSRAYWLPWITDGDPRPPVVVADGHGVVARALCHLLSPHCKVLSPIGDIEMLMVVAAVVGPAVLVSEIELGGHSTLPFLSRLRALRPELKLVVLTARDSLVEREICERAGMRHFVSKCADPGVLTSLVTELSRDWESESKSVASKPTERVGASATSERKTRRRLIAWMLRSGLRQCDIAAATGVTLKAVEYHARRLAGQDSNIEPLRIMSGRLG